MSLQFHNGGSGRLNAVLARLQRVKRSTNGNWIACCPAHADKEPSLWVGTGDDGKILLRCLAGCSFESIVRALEMPMSELFAENDQVPTNGHAKDERSSLTLAEFSQHKRLPGEFLDHMGVRDALYYGRRAVEFEYRKRDGSLARTRVRIGLKGQRFTWKDDGDTIVAYEPDLGVLARQRKELVIVEGESDTLTLLCAGIGALGIPGASHVQALEAHHLEGVERVFVSVDQENGRPDKGAIAFVPGLRARLAELEFVGKVYELKMPGGAKDPSALFQRDPQAFPELFTKLLRDTVEPPHRLDGQWKTLGEWGVFDKPPAPPDWLITRPDEETNERGNPIGVLERGEVGFLLGPPGLGKSIAGCELGLAVATGRKWLDYFMVPKAGRVLLILGEEKFKHVHRRFYELSQAMRLTDAQLQMARDNVVVMPLSGIVAPLVAQDGKTTVETDVVPWLRNRLKDQEWSLIIIDPLSRVAGADSEKDNAQATFFIQIVETLSAMPGAPAVLLVHHVNKAAMSPSAEAPSQADARGSSALTAGGRWCANFAQRQGGAVTLNVTKNNYGPAWGETLVLERGFGGYLRVMPTEAREAAQERARAEKWAEARRKILAAITARPGLSKTKLQPEVQLDRGLVCDVVDQLVAEGSVIESPKNAYRLPTSKGASDG